LESLAELLFSQTVAYPKRWGDDAKRLAWTRRKVRAHIGKSPSNRLWHSANSLLAGSCCGHERCCAGS
jgi:hypothetical protein